VNGSTWSGSGRCSHSLLASSTVDAPKGDFGWRKNEKVILGSKRSRLFKARDTNDQIIHLAATARSFRIRDIGPSQIGCGEPIQRDCRMCSASRSELSSTSQTEREPRSTCRYSSNKIKRALPAWEAIGPVRRLNLTVGFRSDANDSGPRAEVERPS